MHLPVEEKVAGSYPADSAKFGDVPNRKTVRAVNPLAFGLSEFDSLPSPPILLYSSALVTEVRYRIDYEFPVSIEPRSIDLYLTSRKRGFFTKMAL